MKKYVVKATKVMIGGHLAGFEVPWEVIFSRQEAAYRTFLSVSEQIGKTKIGVDGHKFYWACPELEVFDGGGNGPTN